MNWKKAPLALLLVVMLIFAVTPVMAVPKASGEKGAEVKEAAPVLETTAQSAILIDANSNKVLFEKEPDKELPMASVTKLMTLLLAVEAVENGQLKLTDKITASENAWGMGGSQIYLEPGEEFSAEEMLIAIAVGSANDASVAMAEQLGGSEQSFVDMMNQRAKDLGLKHTKFTNCTGLPAEGHYTSAADMAAIIKECIKHPLFMKISSIYEYDLRNGDFKLWNTNKLLKWYTGVDCGKTGWTNQAQYCLASSCEREGLRLVAVVLGTAEPRSHFRETIKLFNYGYAKYKALTMAEKGQVIKNLAVGKGVLDNVDAIVANRVSVIVPRNQDKGHTVQIEAPDKITAPVYKGQVLGQYIVYKDGQEVYSEPLVAASNIKKASLGLQLSKTLRQILKM